MSETQYRKQAARRTLERLARTEVAMVALQHAGYLLPGAARDEEVRAAMAVIRSKILTMRDQAMRDALVVGMLITDVTDEDRKDIVRQTLEWYGRENSQTMHLLSSDGEPPSRYMADAFDGFKTEIRLALNILLNTETTEDDSNA